MPRAERVVIPDTGSRVSVRRDRTDQGRAPRRGHKPVGPSEDGPTKGMLRGRILCSRRAASTEHAPVYADRGVTGPGSAGAGRDQILATWSKPSSTGVSRPKIDTSTLSFWASAWISLTVAGRVANGPSMTVTDSPTS